MALRRELSQSYLRVVTRPWTYFEESPAPNAVEGGFAVFFVALTTVVVTLLLGAALANLFGAQGYVEASSAVWSAIAQVVVFGVLGVFLVWIVAGVVMHLIATASTGGSSLGTTLGVTGYGMLPSIANTILGLGLAYLSLRTVQLSGGPEAVAAQFQQVFQQGGLFRSLLNWAFLLWQAIIWTAGLEQVHDISRANAAVAAGVVAVAMGLLG